jgi:hypothetical protein
MSTTTDQKELHRDGVTYQRSIRNYLKLMKLYLENKLHKIILLLHKTLHKLLKKQISLN